MLDMLVGLLHLIIFPGGLFALVLGLFLKGLDRKVEARLQRRIGPPLVQPLFRPRPSVPSSLRLPSLPWAVLPYVRHCCLFRG